VRFRIKTLWLMCLSLAAVAAAGSAAPPTAALRADSGPAAASSELRSLAAQAREPLGWPALRRYAESAPGPGQKSLAYFVLGYREFQKDRFAEAERDLEKSSSGEPILGDFAEYFHAAALRAGGRPAEAAHLLAGYSERYPQSALRAEAVALLAHCLTDSGQAERALQTLAAEPSLESLPSLLLAKARALQARGRWEEAASAFEQAYCLFPTSSEASDAGSELEKLRTTLGQAHFREPSAELLTSRAETLLARGRHRESLRAFEKALETYPKSPEAFRWKVGRAQSLLGLRRSEEALDALQAPFASDPAMDAERLATLVEAYAVRGNPESMRVIVEQLGAVYPKSEPYSEALTRIANFYRRESDWTAAKPYYEILANSFANSTEADDARWQLGWIAYLEHHDDAARAAFASYVSRNPAARHVPDALYWLGRLAESGGALTEAQALYKALATRYAHNYFGGEASERLKVFPAGPTNEPESLKGSWALVASLPELIPNPPPPPPWLCAIRPSESGKALGAVALLESLSLVELAETYLRSVLSREAASPELYMALGRVESQQGEVARALLAAGKAFPRYEEYDFSRTPEGLWDLLFPHPYWPIVRQESEVKGVDPYLVMGLIRQESAFNPNARSPANARGLMQILPSTASPRRSGRRAATRRLANASYNVQFGSGYLQGLLRNYSGVAEYALAAYHAGKANVDEWLAKNSFREPAEFMESIPIPATRIYVEHVVRDARVYHDLMAGDPAFHQCP
jgi:peptidoglycan lytic transglycosylase